MIAIIIYNQQEITPQKDSLYQDINQRFSKQGVSTVFSPPEENILDRIISHLREENKEIVCITPEDLIEDLTSFWESRKPDLTSREVFIINEEEILKRPNQELEYLKSVIEGGKSPKKEIR